MSDARDGIHLSPEPSTSSKPVVEPGDFVFAATHFDHGHIFAQVHHLAQAGATLKWVYEPDPAKRKDILEKYPEARLAESLDTILEDDAVHLVTSAAIPDQRAGIGIQVMEAGKDYFTDKSPFTSLEQLDRAREAVKQTGRKYMVCYSERLLNAATWHAGDLIAEGAIGRILQVLITAPHNLNASARPDWFFQKKHYGGILTDIGSHQFEQFLHFTGARDGTINFARVENFGNPSTPELEDFGEASATMDTGASCYCRLDWFNPSGSRVWGDGRAFILGDTGYMELRKYRDLIHGGQEIIYLVDQSDEYRIDCSGRGFPFFGRLILDCLNRTEKAMTQEHAFKAAELSMQAQTFADQCRNS